MGARKLPQRVNLPKKDMTQLARPWFHHRGTRRVPANHFERVGNAGRVTRELHRGSIGQQFTLTTHCRFYQRAKQASQPAQHPQAYTNGHDLSWQTIARARGTAPGHALIARATSPPYDDLAYITDEGDPFHHCRQADIEPHVTVKNVAEFMRNDALQLLAIKML